MILNHYTLGIGDRFGRQGKAQLRALIKARELGVAITPVWNKSNREHLIIHVSPMDVRREADAAVLVLAWEGAYHVDADHIGLKTVELFLDPCDFFTLDVAEFIGAPPEEKDLAGFLERRRPLLGTLSIPDLQRPLTISRELIESVGRKYLRAVKEAGRIWRRIAQVGNPDGFVTEISMDETNQPQSPVELQFILTALADEGVSAQTIAPRFTGRFNKGVDSLASRRDSRQNSKPTWRSFASRWQSCPFPASSSLAFIRAATSSRSIPACERS